MGFYMDFSMFITEAHKGLRQSDDFGYGQAAAIQCFAYVQEDDSAVTVPYQLLNPYECHVVMPDLTVLYSTTNVSTLFTIILL